MERKTKRSSTNFALLKQTSEGREKLKAISRKGAEKVNQNREQARINRISAAAKSSPAMAKITVPMIPESAVPGGMAQAHAPAPVVDVHHGLEPERLLTGEN